MPEANINITDMDLLDRLKHSYIDPAQKQELESLLPQMTNSERAKLIELIDQADDEYRTTQVKYKEDLEGFRKEPKEGDEKFRKNLEEGSKEIQEFEKEIREMTGNRVNTQRETVLKQAKKKHTLRNLLIGLLLLAALAGGVLYYLNAL